MRLWLSTIYVNASLQVTGFFLKNQRQDTTQTVIIQTLKLNINTRYVFRIRFGFACALIELDTSTKSSFFVNVLFTLTNFPHEMK